MEVMEMYKVSIRNPELWDQDMDTGLTKEEAEKIAADWNRRHGFTEKVKWRDACEGQAYVQKAGESQW